MQALCTAAIVVLPSSATGGGCCFCCGEDGWEAVGGCAQPCARAHVHMCGAYAWNTPKAYSITAAAAAAAVAATLWMYWAYNHLMHLLMCFPVCLWDMGSWHRMHKRLHQEMHQVNLGPHRDEEREMCVRACVHFWPCAGCFYASTYL